MYKRVMEEKQNGKYIPVYETTEKIDVLEWLTSDLMAKYLHKASYVKRIQDTPNYNGTRTVTVYYDNNTRSIYTVKS